MRPLFLLFVFLLLTGCDLFRPAASNNAAATVQSGAVASVLTPNDPNLPYPIYSSFEEIEPLFRQNDGITYVINFWATWCKPCIAEMPYLEQLAAENPPGRLQVIMISLDRPADIRTRMKDFVEDRPLDLPVVSFTDDNFRNWIGRVSPDWRRSSIPATYVYRNGRSHFNGGAISSYRELRGLVDRVR